MIEPTGGAPSFDVPGELGALRAHAGRLRTGAGGMDGTAGALGGASTGSWTGLAADAFRASQSGQVAAWSYGADAVRRAAAALEAYAGALADAQRRAAAAGRSYEQGVTAAQAAETSYTAAVSRAQQAPPGSVIVVPTFTDPGAAQREAALGEMVSLRAAVDQAAASCADAEGVLGRRRGERRRARVVLREDRVVRVAPRQQVPRQIRIEAQILRARVVHTSARIDDPRWVAQVLRSNPELRPVLAHLRNVIRRRLSR